MVVRNQYADNVPVRSCMSELDPPPAAPAPVADFRRYKEEIKWGRNEQGAKPHKLE